ncbi:MAG TPA: DUF4268 domain-containing protein [Chitinophagaceae bacterium]|nr:DUF4268 domain-containing protein [Chitinophagaceae bacterium]
MYSKQEASKLRQEFWTAFGRYMGPVLSAEGEPVNWINYRTGEKNIHFKMDAGNRSAYIAIELTHPDPVIQQIYYEHFLQLKQLLHNELGEEWTWKLHDTDEHGKTISRIYKEMPDVSLFRNTDWPALVSFFKERIVALDAFWSKVKYGFEALR